MSAAKVTQKDHALQALALGESLGKSATDSAPLLEGLVPFSEILEQTLGVSDSGKKSEAPVPPKATEKTKKPAEAAAVTMQKPQIVAPVILPEQQEVALTLQNNVVTPQTLQQPKEIQMVASVREDVELPESFISTTVAKPEEDAVKAPSVEHMVAETERAPVESIPAEQVTQSAQIVSRPVVTAAPIVQKKETERVVEIASRDASASKKEDFSKNSKEPDDALMEEGVPKEAIPLQDIKPQDIKHLIKQARTEKPTAVETLAVDAKAELTEKALKIEELLQQSSPVILRGIVNTQAQAMAPRSLLQQEVPLSAYTQTFDMKPAKDIASELGVMGRQGVHASESLHTHAQHRMGSESGGSSLGSSRDPSANMMQSQGVSSDKIASNFQEALQKTQNGMNAESIEKMQSLQQLVSDFRSKLTGLTKSIRIPLRHERYGAIDVNIKFNHADKRVQADFDVENEQMLYLIKDNISEIERIFKETGFNSAHAVTLQKISLTHKKIGV